MAIDPNLISSFPKNMTNAASSKQHGMKSVHEQQPKSKLRFRKNKQKANIRKEERRALKLSQNS